MRNLAVALIVLISVALSEYLKTSRSERTIAYIPDKSMASPLTTNIKIPVPGKSRKIVIAVIDTGADFHHRVLRNRIWVNSAEDLNGDGNCTDADYDGIDQDGNNLVDDCMGWNFANGNNNIMDTHGHGTHISGIIAAISNVFSEYDIRIMPLKYYDAAITKNHVKNTVAAINYAINMGVQIINYSAGGDTPSLEEKRAILRAQKKGILFVAAAGNEKNNVARIPYYPSSYNLPNILSVTAVNGKGDLLARSNWGRTIDIAAPGFNVMSTLPNNRYGNMTGTSMAASFITGLISVIMAKENCSAFRAVGQIKSSSIHSKKLDARVENKRIVDPAAALRITGIKRSVREKIEKIFFTASIL